MNLYRALQKTFALATPVMMTSSFTRTFSAFRSQPLIQPFLMSRSQPVISQIAGLKHVVNPHRRCRHCYMVVEDERTWVFCDKYPRHKQVTKAPKRAERNKMIMTHATQGGKKYRNRKPRGGMHMLTQSGFRLDF